MVRTEFKSILGGVIKESGGGDEFKYDIFDTL
jgi:hypothetical protein